MDLLDFINYNKTTFSTQFRTVAQYRKIGYADFGKLYDSEKKNSTMFYYFTNKPNASIYSIVKVSRLFEVDISYFFKAESAPPSKVITTKMTIEEHWKSVLNNISKVLSYYIEKGYKTTLEFEVAIGIDNSDLGKIENAKSNITIRTLSKLAHKLNIEILDFIEGQIPE